jgi:hypothetical protein
MIKNFIAISRTFFDKFYLSLKTEARSLKNIMKNGIATPAHIADTLPTNISTLSFVSEYLKRAKKDTSFPFAFIYYFYSINF